MKKCEVGGGAVGSCNKDPECQLHCTESATSEGGKLSCCEGGPKHQNSCPNKIDGKCEPKKPEGEGGKPPEMPKPPQGGGGGGGAPAATSTEGCATVEALTTSTAGTSTPGSKPCPQEGGTLGSYFSNIFSTQNGGVAGSVQNTLSNAADKLSSFLFGTEPTPSASSESAINTPGAGTAPTTPSGTSVQLTPQVIQTQPVSSGAAGSPSAAVTGFGSTQNESSQQSGMLTAISETLTGIGVTLKNLLSSFAF